MWTIDGKTWDDIVSSDYKGVIADPAAGSIEVWDFVNSSGGWFHPVHVHLVDFKILSRNGRAPYPYEQGPKDVAYVGEGETVNVVMKFGPHEGRYMIHCHNLVHEDHDMMSQFRVGPSVDPTRTTRSTARRRSRRWERTSPDPSCGCEGLRAPVRCRRSPRRCRCRRRSRTSASPQPH